VRAKRTNIHYIVITCWNAWDLRHLSVLIFMSGQRKLPVHSCTMYITRCWIERLIIPFGNVNKIKILWFGFNIWVEEWKDCMEEVVEGARRHPFLFRVLFTLLLEVLWAAVNHKVNSHEINNCTRSSLWGKYRKLHAVTYILHTMWNKVKPS